MKIICISFYSCVLNAKKENQCKIFIYKNTIKTKLPTCIENQISNADPLLFRKLDIF